MDTYFLSILIVFIPFVIGLVLFKHFTIELRVFFIFVAYGLLNEISSFILIYVIEFKNNMPLAHLYGLVTFLTVSVFYRYLLAGFIKSKWIDLAVGSYSIYYAVNSVFLQSFYTYPGIAIAIGTIIILSFIILYFARVMQEAKIKNLFAEPAIWISGALLIFYSGNLFFFVLFNLLLDFSLKFARFAVQFRIGMNVFVYLMISVGFIKQRMLRFQKTENAI